MLIRKEALVEDVPQWVKRASDEEILRYIPLVEEIDQALSTQDHQRFTRAWSDLPSPLKDYWEAKIKEDSPQFAASFFSFIV